jgi:hypothetical protein
VSRKFGAIPPQSTIYKEISSMGCLRKPQNGTTKWNFVEYINSSLFKSRNANFAGEEFVLHLQIEK